MLLLVQGFFHGFSAGCNPAGEKKVFYFDVGKILSPLAESV